MAARAQGADESRATKEPREGLASDSSSEEDVGPVMQSRESGEERGGGGAQAGPGREPSGPTADGGSPRGGSGGRTDDGAGGSDSDVGPRPPADSDSDSDSDVGPRPPADSGSDSDVGPRPPSDAGGADSQQPAPAAAARPKRRLAPSPGLPFEREYLRALPIAPSYERSYMHKSEVTAVAAASRLGFIITGSAEGDVRFWKKLGVGVGLAAGGGGTSGDETGIEFAKSFRAHSGEVLAISVSPDGSLAASLSVDRTVKVFDVATFDMIQMVSLQFDPSCLAWAWHRSDEVSARLAVADARSGAVRVYDARGGGEGGGGSAVGATGLRPTGGGLGGSSGGDGGGAPLADGSDEEEVHLLGAAKASGAAGAARAADDAPGEGEERGGGGTPGGLAGHVSAPALFEVSLHAAPVRAMAYSAARGAVISIDTSGVIEYWRAEDGRPLAEGLRFDYKFDTDLYSLATAEVGGVALAVDDEGSRFVVGGEDHIVRLFELSTGKLLRTFDLGIVGCLRLLEDSRVAAEAEAELSAEAEGGADVGGSAGGTGLDPSGGAQAGGAFLAGLPSGWPDSIELGRRAATEEERVRTGEKEGREAAGGPATGREQAEARARLLAADPSAPLALRGAGAADPAGASVSPPSGLPARPLRWDLCLDRSGHFLLAPSPLGVLLVNLETGRVRAALGGGDSGERFLRLAIYQRASDGRVKAARVKRSRADAPPAAAGGGGLAAAEDDGDPTLIASAWRSQRFYLFTRREHGEAAGHGGAAGAGAGAGPTLQPRDVLNERVAVFGHGTGADGAGGGATGGGPDGLAGADAAGGLPRGAVLRTTRGDVAVKLYPRECPRTVENFTTHARNGYYDGVLFHRVIKGFMLQTGDPLGDGTGGESIWGGEFDDEIRRELRHDRPFTLSMANAGPNTNGSQFFITTVPTPWLDGKHTVFGRVVAGADVVRAIEKVKTNPRSDKPVDEIRILNIEVRDDVEG